MKTPATKETFPSALTGSHLRTYEAIFQRPTSRNLGWQDMHALLRQLSQVEEASDGNLTVTRNGQTLVLHRPRTKDFAEIDQVATLRHFLERSDTNSREWEVKDSYWLLVIDHREARIFRSLQGGTNPDQVLPHAPEDFFRHAPQSKDFSRGKEKPDMNSYFEPVAKALQAAGRIIILGCGTGMSSEMDQFVAWSKIHHPELAMRTIGSIAVDESHLTPNQLLAKAREWYTNAQGAEA